MGRPCRGGERGCWVFPWPTKSAMCYNESSWRPGKSAEDAIQMPQVWSCGRKGTKGSQNWYHPVCDRGREEIKWQWGGSQSRELQWEDQRRADISDAEKRDGFLHRKRWWWLEEAEQIKIGMGGWGPTLQPEDSDGMPRKRASSNEVGPTAKMYGMRS